MTAEPEPKWAAAELAIVEEAPVEALASDSATIAVLEESAVTALDVDERWPRLPRSASSPRAPPPAEPREFVFVSGASVVLPPPTTSEPARRRRRRRRRRKPKAVSPLTSPTSVHFPWSSPDWASPTSSIASSLSEALSSPWSSPRPHLGEQHHLKFPRGDSSSSSFWSSTSSLWSSTTSAASWASSSASSLLSFAAAPAQGDGPDHYRPDSPDDFRVACRDVSMPLPE